MVKPIYWKSIAIGLAGILIIVALFLFSAYMADQDMKDYYRMPRGYDNDFVGVIWWVFFILAVLVALAFIGALSAWASSRDITSIRGTIIASALAGGVPIALATIIIVSLFTIAFVNTPEHDAANFFSTPFPLFLLYLFYAFAGMMLSIIGGLLYAMPGKALLHGKTWGTRISFRRPLAAGAACGALVLIVYAAGLAVAGTPPSTTIFIVQLSLFMIISLAAGALAASAPARALSTMADVLKASLTAGIIVGFAGVLGYLLAAIGGKFNMDFPGVIISACIFLEGMTLAVIGGILFAVLQETRRRLSPETAEADRKSLYRNSVKIGLVLGLSIAIWSLVPGLAYAVLSSFGRNGDLNLYMKINTIAGGLAGMAVTILLLVVAAVLTVRFSPVRTANEAMATSAVAGAIAGIVSIAGDLINRMLDTWFRPFGPGVDFSNTTMANLLLTLGCAPLKIAVFIAICVVAGVVFASFVLGLNNGGGTESRDQ